ncbi:MAG: hypothetical protein ACLQIB_12900 [Isosphaeraceae bacterium]
MNRRHLMGIFGAMALAALFSLGAAAEKTKPGQVACGCCGNACVCPACICDGAGKVGAMKAAEDCACCGGAACCASSSVGIATPSVPMAS